MNSYQIITVVLKNFLFPRLLKLLHNLLLLMPHMMLPGATKQVLLIVILTLLTNICLCTN